MAKGRLEVDREFGGERGIESLEVNAVRRSLWTLAVLKRAFEDEAGNLAIYPREQQALFEKSLTPVPDAIRDTQPRTKDHTLSMAFNLARISTLLSMQLSCISFRGRVGLRRWIKAPISQGAWVRIPPGTCAFFVFWLSVANSF